jgi:hypothetical protein
MNREVCMEQQVSEQGDLLREVGFPIYQGRGWMKFLGIMSIIQGVIAAFTLVGIFVAWLPIWVGIVLYQSATRMERAYATGDKSGFYESMSKLKLYFMIQGITTLLGIVIAIFAMSLGMLGLILDTIR